MLRGAVALLVALATTGTAAAPRRLADYQPTTSIYRTLDNPRTGDAFMFRGAIQQYAQDRSNRIFGSLASLLGGQAPQINFVPTGSQFTTNHMSANIADAVGAPLGTVNMDPLSVDGLVEDQSPIHSVVVNQMPHEMAHTRQAPATLAQALTREGGAQAFADLEAQQAAAGARIPYTPGNYDGAFAQYVQAVQQPPYGQGWITAGQFGH